MLYHIEQIRKYAGVKLAEHDFIFEFGGGYGCLCEMLYRDGFRGEYYLYDVPVMNTIQRYYLSRNGINKVHCVSSLNDIPMPKGKSAFVATMSFSEIPGEHRYETQKMIADYDSIVIAYASNFYGIDNEKYFGNLQEQIKRRWLAWPIDYDLAVAREGKMYLVGARHDNGL
jgi:hypothetical protein